MPVCRIQNLTIRNILDSEAETEKCECYLNVTETYSSMQGPRYPFAISPMAVIISFWLNKNAYDEFSSEDTNQPNI